MHPDNGGAARVARPTYSRQLLRPLADHETPASKLGLLRTELGGASDEERVAIMLDRHVIGHDVRDYPVELRGSPRRGPPASSRVQLALNYFGVSNHEQALLQLAVRHIQGFRPAATVKQGERATPQSEASTATPSRPKVKMNMKLEQTRRGGKANVSLSYCGPGERSKLPWLTLTILCMA